MIHFAANAAAMAAAKIASAFEWPDNAKNCQFPLRFRHFAGGGPSHGHRQHAQKNW